MDTKEVAERLGTNPRQLRAFLRSGHSTFAPVGSGARYDFTERELPTLIKRFAEWRNQGKPTADTTPAAANVKPARRRKPGKSARQVADEKTWAEEGPVVIPDIRNPRVRAQVRRDAEAAENRLGMLLISRGVHVMQGYTPVTKKKAS